MPGESIWICPNCGRRESWSNGTCRACGTKYSNQPRLWVCSICGQVNPWRDSKCTCGARY